MRRGRHGDRWLRAGRGYDDCMDVLISVDLEGIAGVATRQQTLPTGRDYGRARNLMTGEANAAIVGAFDGGAASVVVVDAHGPADNLLSEQLDPRADYVIGDPKPLDMVHGLSGDTGVVLFVGYHAGAAADGVLAHTFSGGAFADVRINDASVSEAEVNGLLAAELGVPVGLVTGDDVTCAMAERAFPNVTTVAVKKAIGRTAAQSMHPGSVWAQITAGAMLAVQRAVAGDLAPVAVPDQLDIMVEFRPSGVSELATLVPGARRIDHRTVGFAATTPREAMNVLNVWAALASYVAGRA